MKWLTGILASSALVVGVSLPALSNPEMTSALSSGKEIRGQVESVDGSVLKLKTSAGDTQVYRVDPTVISALKLETGSNVVVDGSRLQSGVVTYLTPNNASIELDGNAGEKDYILTPVSRRYLSLGDRVVVTPDLRVVREDHYKLTASDLRLQSVAVASSSSSSMSTASSSSSSTVTSQTNTGSAEVAPAVPAPVEESPAVKGLW
ncbi:hypothetical protein [Altericista sp. CCNU0014]|uniref:hypothetical protein n=1 Tax=Altericista sp. CCNU0014 TaxID=3082949 RepID=UPI00385090CA